MKILVVEDELYARESLVHQIRSYDTDQKLTVLEASNGEEGEQLYILEKPDLVLTDIRMPKKDGLELLSGIREKNPDAIVILLSAFSDFEYARTALQNGASDYLLKPIDDQTLKKCLDQVLQKKRNEEKEKLMTGKDMVTKFIQNSIISNEKQNFVEKSMFSRVFRQWQMSVFMFLEEYPDIESLFQELEKQYGNGFWVNSRYLELEPGLGILVCSANEDSIFFWRRITKSMQELGYPMALATSKVYDQAERIADAYQETINCLKYKIYGKDHIFTSDRIEAEHYREYNLSKTTESDFLDYLERGAEQKAIEILQTIFEDIVKENILAESLEILYSRILFLCYQGMPSNNVIYPLTYHMKGILQFHSLAEMKEELEEIIKKVCRDKTQNGEINNGGIVSFLMKYVREHFDEDISLKEIAETQLFMNQTYLSHLFSEKTGNIFSNYVKNVRMEEAKKLLVQGNFSVSEVATRTGYNDTSQFIRIFKQETGMTPKKYAMQAKGEKLT